MDFIDKIESKIHKAKKQRLERKLTRAKVKAKRSEEIATYERQLGKYEVKKSKSPTAGKAKKWLANAGKKTDALFGGDNRMNFGNATNDFSDSFGAFGVKEPRKTRKNPQGFRWDF